jgi:hypothetical protein
MIRDLPIFWLFISTAGRFNLFYPWPPIESDPTNRALVRNANSRPLVPISEIRFDCLISVVRCMFTPVTPLESGLLSISIRFGSHWDTLELQKETVLAEFVKRKLLNGPNVLAKDNWPESLTCLCMRFALEFVVDEMARDVAWAQVERHMCESASQRLTNSRSLSRLPGQNRFWPRPPMNL